MVSLADTAPAGDRTDVRGRYIFVRPSASGLDALSGLVEAGALRVELAGTHPLEEAAAAHRRLEEGHVRGKVVLDVSP